MIKRIFTAAFRAGQAEISTDSRPDYKVMLICITVAFSLTMIKYLGDYNFVVLFFKNLGFIDLSNRFNELMVRNKNGDLYQLLYWVSVVIFFYLVPPLLVIKFVFKEKFADYGLNIKDAFKDYKVYVLMLCVMIPLVLFFSRTASFQARYPFYSPEKNQPYFLNLVVWEVFYFLQFFALEFFFRGFMLHGTKQRFGYYSVFVMTIPYCMIHFGKPLPETLAAIIAGIVLGSLSLKSKSIWLGVAIHYSVAITMDLCALYQKGVL